MDRFQIRPTRPASNNAQGAANQPNVQETFAQMANATASRGVAGKLLVLSLIIVSVAVTAFVAFAILRGLSGNSLVKKDQYQAVFLEDGQVYFGKLAGLEDDNPYVVLEDIFYLQVEQQIQPKTTKSSQTQQPKVSLAKLGNELHGPEDKMYVNRDRMLFWENLKNDGQVAKAIAEFKTNGGQPVQTQQPTTTPTTNSGSSNTNTRNSNTNSNQ